MAKGVLFDVAARIIEKADHLSGQEIGQLWGVKDEILKLGKRVSTIKAVLLDAEEGKQSNEVKEWLKRLNDAIYDADNLVDDISTEALRWEVMTRNTKAEQVRIFFSKSRQFAYGRKMGHKVKKMRERLDAMSRDMESFHFEERLVETHDRNRVRGKTLSPEIFVGREEDKQEIGKFLSDPNVEENVSILSIVGGGGIGKTALAKIIFDDEKEYFEQKIWVCVSDNFDVKIIVQKILEFAKKKRQENLEMKTLINDLKKEIQGKKCLLVLDDLWNEDPVKWLNLKNILVGVCARGSKVLVTTRNALVAKNVRSSHILFLKFLSPEDSWTLFKHMAFENGQEPRNSIMGYIGWRIALWCEGLPLFIKTIGGLLYFRNSEKEWVSFINNELSNLDTDKNGFLSILMLSYDNLPSYLKQCFTYCCLFPKDYKFHKPTLIQMWIAQEFIRSPGQNLELGHDYFMELLWRSFFQEVEKDERDNNILYFKIHDDMHDLVISVAKFDSKFFCSNEEINEKIHHVSFDGWLHSSSQIPISLFKARRIRTFLLPRQPDNPCKRLDKSTCIALVTNFKFIRLLDLHNLGIEIVPSSIEKMKHLRYLDLSYNEHIKMLPNSITKLQNLQTLKLTACTHLNSLPGEINRLVNLMYLEISGCVDLKSLPPGMDQLTKCDIVRQSAVAKDPRGSLLIELRHGIDAPLESDVANLKEKEHLQVLELRWIEDEVKERDAVYDEPSLQALGQYRNLEVLSIYRYWGVSFRSWRLPPTNLVELVFCGCKKLQYLPQLDQFPFLKVLELDSLLSMEYIEERDSNEISGRSLFQSLKELRLKYCPILKEWWPRRDSIMEVHDDHKSVGINTSTTSMTQNDLLPSFCHLSNLCILGCPKLTSMPLFPYLEKLELCHCSFEPLKQTICSTFANSSFPLSKLTSLEIGRMKEHLPKECLQNLGSLNYLLIYDCHGPLLQGIQHLTALKKLDICSSEVFDLPNDEIEEWQGLRSLNSLCLFQLLELKSLPLGLQHVTSLQKLMIDYCPSLNNIQDWIHNLTSLQSLEILQCPKLKSLPIGICGLTSLETLVVSKCPKFTSFPKDMSGLASLQVLNISEFISLTSLPEGIRDVTSLQTLDISKWHNLTSLPEWMGDLASLETLYISECPNLISLPEKMRGLTSLQTLCIEDCPKLLERCKKETGEDWHKIAHIPNLLRDRAGRKLGNSLSHHFIPISSSLSCSLFSLSIQYIYWRFNFS